MSLAYSGKLDNIRKSETGGVLISGTVLNYAALPTPATSYLDQIWYVQNNQGVWPINFKGKGYYIATAGGWVKWEWDAEVFEALNAHAAQTIAHGTTSTVVGINDTQELKNKTIDYNQNTILNLPPSSLVLFNQKPLEAPNGVRLTFTIPNGHVVKAGTTVMVMLNGVAYNPDNIVLNLARTQFTIVNDHKPKTIDVLTISYDRE